MSEEIYIVLNIVINKSRNIEDYSSKQGVSQILNVNFEDTF